MNVIHKSDNDTGCLNRDLGIFSLVAYGLNYMIPLAPAIVFGFIMKESGGTVALPYLIALLGMFFTALCYCFFIKRSPYAGSVFSYTKYAFKSKFIASITGWNIALDYVMVPAVTAESSAHYVHKLIPFLSINIISILFILLCGSLSLFSIKSIGRSGIIFLIISEAVLIICLFSWGYSVHNGAGTGSILSTKPFEFSGTKALLSSASIAILSFLGFDAISTLAEEARNPKSDIPRAILICITIGAVTMFLTGYLGMSVIPDWKELAANKDFLSSTMFYVNNISGGHILNQFFITFFVISMAVFGVVAITGSSRLLYGISKNGIIPKKLSLISQSTHIPILSILLVVFLQIVTAMIIPIDMLAELMSVYGVG